MNKWQTMAIEIAARQFPETGCRDTAYAPGEKTFLFIGHINAEKKD